MMLNDLLEKNQHKLWQVYSSDTNTVWSREMRDFAKSETERIDNAITQLDVGDEVKRAKLKELITLKNIFNPADFPEKRKSKKRKHMVP